MIIRLFHFPKTEISAEGLPNGLRYPLVGGTRERRFDGINFKPHKLLKNAVTPTRRVHAVLGALCVALRQSPELYRSIVTTDLQNITLIPKNQI